MPSRIVDVRMMSRAASGFLSAAAEPSCAAAIQQIITTSLSAGQGSLHPIRAGFAQGFECLKGWSREKAQNIDNLTKDVPSRIPEHSCAEDSIPQVWKLLSSSGSVCCMPGLRGSCFSDFSGLEPKCF